MTEGSRPTPHGNGMPVRAVVQAGGEVTPYVRAGRGRTLLLLGGGRSRDLPPLALVAAFAGAFRVIAPADPLPEGADRAPWLCGILEGLGLERPVVVVLGAAPWLEAFRRRHPGRVGPVVLVSTADASGDPRGLAARVAEEVGARD